MTLEEIGQAVNDDLRESTRKALDAAGLIVSIVPCNSAPSRPAGANWGRVIAQVEPADVLKVGKTIGALAELLMNAIVPESDAPGAKKKSKRQ